jgi:hypothetical protein
MTSSVIGYDGEESVVDSAVAAADREPGTGIFRYSGLINGGEGEPLTDFYNFFFAETMAPLVSLTVREGSATLESSGPDGSFLIEVEPGLPFYGIIADGLASNGFSVYPTDATQADIELEIFCTTAPRSGAEYSPFLWLNASRGITLGTYNGLVTAWKDTRPESLAKLNFEWYSAEVAHPEYSLLPDPGGLELIAEDPDFNGHPSVVFSRWTGTLYYTGNNATSTFNFMDKDEDWCLLAMIAPSDDAMGTNTMPGSKHGRSLFFRYVDPGNQISPGFDSALRPFAFTANPLGEEEIVAKPSVVIFQYDAADGVLHVYCQGRWMAELTLAGSASMADSVFAIMGNYGFNLQNTCKVADYRIYNRLCTAAEMNAYIAEAEETYGIVDTADQAFPFVSDAKVYLRASRGINPMPSILPSAVDSVHDKRFGITTNVDFAKYSTSAPKWTDADLVTGSPCLQFDGTGELVNSTGDWDCLAGGVAPGATVIMLVYQSPGYPNYQGWLLSMGSYHSGTLAGTNISYGDAAWYDSGTSVAVGYETDTGDDDDVVRARGSDFFALDEPMLIVYQLDATGSLYRIIEYRVANDYVVHDSGWSAYGFGGGTTASAAISLMSSIDHAENKGGLAEFAVLERLITEAELVELKAYVRRVYA